MSIHASEYVTVDGIIDMSGSPGTMGDNLGGGGGSAGSVYITCQNFAGHWHPCAYKLFAVFICAHVVM